MQAAQNGSADAFGELVRRYQDRVYNTCYRLCHDDDEALDLTQTTFLKALEALPRFEARSSFYTWLFRIAVNAALSARRGRRRRTAALDDTSEAARGWTSAANPRPPAVSATLERREEYEQVEAALAQLDPEFRVAIVLKDIEGLDYEAIAAILEVPVGTVKSRICRGRAMLRTMLLKEQAEVDP